MIAVAALLRARKAAARISGRTFRIMRPSPAVPQITLDAAMAAARDTRILPDAGKRPDDDLSPLPAIMLEPLVRAALLEDLGRAGDLTTDAVVPADIMATTVLTARQAGIVAGLDLATLAFRLIDPERRLRGASCPTAARSRRARSSPR